MYLNEIYDETFVGQIKTYTNADFKTDDIVTNADSVYKVSLYKLTDVEYVSGYTLEASSYSAFTTQPPSSALKIALKKGDYALAYDNGGFVSKDTNKINDCISSTVGDVQFDTLDVSEDSEAVAELTNESALSFISSKYYTTVKYLRFKVTGKSKFCVWVKNANAIGRLDFKIYKLDTAKQEASFIASKILRSYSKSYDFRITSVGLYETVITEIKNDAANAPAFKYPQGTYQITLQQRAATGFDENELQEKSEEDAAQFDMNGGKLQSLNGITIPADADPLNRYIMLGKVGLNLFIDFNNDEYYIYPVSYAECFMNLFVPSADMSVLEETEDHALYHIVDYSLIGFDFRNVNEIKRNMQRWVNCDISQIKSDPYELYFYVDNFDLFDWYYVKFNEVVEKHFFYLKLSNIQAYVEDDVTVQRQMDDVLSSRIDHCEWEKCSKVSRYNFIEWSSDDQWQQKLDANDQPIQNKIFMTPTGEGYLRITKTHFKNVTGVDLSTTTSGELTEAQFKALKLNEPIVNGYQRFQNWLSVRLQ